MTMIDVGAGIALLAVRGILMVSTTTFTPPVFSNVGEELVCIVQNVGTLPVTVESELRGANDNLLAAGDGQVMAGRTLALAASSVGGSGSCRFTFIGDTENVRGYILRRRLLTGETRVLLPAFPVRRDLVGTIQTVTPPLRTIGDEVFACRVHNLSSEMVEVDTALLNEKGQTVATSTDNLLGGRIDDTIVTQDPILGAYCRFTVAEHGDEVRGYAVFYGMQSDAELVLAAMPVMPVGTETAISPPVSSVAGDATACVAQNLDTIGVIVSAELVDDDGMVLDDGMLLIPPGEVAQVAGTTEAGQHLVCRFTFEDPTDDVRGFISRFPAGIFRNTETATGEPTATGSAAPASPTVSATAAASATITASPTSGTPASATVTPSVSPTTPAGPPCAGDCNGNGTVSIDELVTLVNIALQLADLAQCPAGDANGDGTIAIDELITAVRHALEGCPG